MPKKPETLFKNRIRPLLEKIPKSWWVKYPSFGTRGIPDFLGCVNGHLVALELKRDEDQELTKLQAWTLGQIAKGGAYARRVDPSNWEQVYEELQEL